LADNPEAEKAGPNIRQRRVAAKLKEWRGRTGRSTQDVANQLRWSAAKLNRLEKASQKPYAGPAEIIALAAILGVDETERDQVVTYAVKGQEGLVWWRAFVKAGRDFDDFMATESEATRVRNKESLILPGLAQDEAYMTAAILAWMNEPDEEIMEARRELRRRRQARVTAADNPVHFHAVVYNAALTQPLLPPREMAGTLGHLLSLSELPNVTVQILMSCPAGFDLAYHLMNFEGEDEAAAVFVDQLNSGLFIESAEDVEAYNLNFKRLARQALDPDASARHIDEVRRALT
jgi:transcriptional regulator with XRE-family HTH domain